MWVEVAETQKHTNRAIGEDGKRKDHKQKDSASTNQGTQQQTSCIHLWGSDCGDSVKRLLGLFYLSYLHWSTKFLVVSLFFGCSYSLLVLLFLFSDPKMEQRKDTKLVNATWGHGPDPLKATLFLLMLRIYGAH